MYSFIEKEYTSAKKIYIGIVFFITDKFDTNILNIDDKANIFYLQWRKTYYYNGPSILNFNMWNISESALLVLQCKNNNGFIIDNQPTAGVRGYWQ